MMQAHARAVTTVDGRVYPTPLFLPVFQQDNPFVTIPLLEQDFGVRGLITNAFFLYKKRELKNTVLDRGIRDFLRFSGLIVTDSGAFQQFSGPLYLSNKKIITFQQDIGVDVISPLDLITPPGDKRTTATKKLELTLKRIAEGLTLVDRAILVGVQQGGRFLDLRTQAIRQLVELQVKYIALGSLVPMFTKNHHLEFLSKVIAQARQFVPNHIPMHLYGAGDPVEIPFYVACGCDIFDSSSFIHYARQGWYMTPYGAFDLQQANFAALPYTCACPYCRGQVATLKSDEVLLARHNLWVIMQVMAQMTKVIADGALPQYLQHVLDVHQRCFPQSQLGRSWEIYRMMPPSWHQTTTEVSNLQD
jgi:7-cyano-7-deazaguanine tRNA-ribosyltransferase